LKEREKLFTMLKKDERLNPDENKRTESQRNT